MPLKNTIINFVAGSDQFPLEQRLLRIVSFQAALMTFIASVTNIFIGLSWSVVFMTLALGCFFLLLFVALNHPRQRLYLWSSFFVYFTMFFMSGVWFLNAGVTGSMTLCFMALWALGISILPRRHVLPFVVILGLDLSLLMYLELHYPALITPYSSTQMHQWDMFVALIFSNFVIGPCLLFLRILRDQDRQIAQRALQYQEKFFGQLSHELRTPLNAILGFTHILQKKSLDKLDDKEQGYLQRVSNSGKHMLDLVNDLLDLARLEQKEIKFKFETFYLYDLLYETYQNFLPLAQKMGHHLEFQSEETLRLQTLCSDQRRILQITQNLINNALKYTPPSGKITLILTDDHENFYVKVRDTGPGIAKEDQERIFLPFIRINKEYNNQSAGLGLAIAQQFAQQMGCLITLESQLGAGTTFTLKIPKISSESETKMFRVK